MSSSNSNSNIVLTFPDGSKHTVQSQITALEVIKTKIGEGLARAALCAQIDETLIDLEAPLTQSGNFTVHTFKSEKGREVFWHSSAHILAIAVKRLFPKAQLTIGPPIAEGFYYDFAVETPFTEEDVQKIEVEMQKVIKEDLSFSRHEIALADAKKQFSNNPFKLELIEEYKDSVLTVYKTGDFSDLCRGPHIPNTGKVKAIKIIRLAGAYWRGDSTKTQLQRIYGISFPSKDELKAYVEKIELAKQRDHRKLVKDLDLAMFHEYAPGAPFFLPKGATMYNVLLQFIRDEYKKRGYNEVITPQLFNKKLWETSGHWAHYKDDMFIVNIEGAEHSLKPMNCPSHCLMYRSQRKSYKDLPLRIADFGVLHRNELSGALSGMTRVRKFSQDDAHIFCTVDQIESEVLGVLEFIQFVWEQIFGIKITYALSTRPEKALGTKELWDKAESLLASAMKKAGITYTIKAGDGAFYGPKIDIDLEDALGRKWQCPTCQLDFNLPERFDLEYEGSDGKMHRPVMVHRAVLGSVERFFAMMVEHFAGKFPLWVSPVQVRILPIADRHIEYANSVKTQMEKSGLRVEVDEKSLTTANKVRLAQEAQINYILVVGDKEVEQKTVNVRTRNNEVLGEKSVSEFTEQLVVEVESKK